MLFKKKKKIPCRFFFFKKDLDTVYHDAIGRWLGFCVQRQEGGSEGQSIGGVDGCGRSQTRQAVTCGAVQAPTSSSDSQTCDSCRQLKRSCVKLHTSFLYTDKLEHTKSTFKKKKNHEMDVISTKYHPPFCEVAGGITNDV